MADKFPFAFDMTKMTEAFRMPAFDMAALQDAQNKNMAAWMQANKTVLAGYQAVYKRQAELFETALAETKDRIAAAQGKPMTAETAEQNFETMKGAVEKALADLKDVAELAQTANTEAFEIIKARTEEVFAEMKDATEKFVN